MDLEELKGRIQCVCWEITNRGVTLDARALTRLAQQNGWYEDRTESSHHQFKHPDGEQYRITLAYHGNNATFDRSVVKVTIKDIFQPQLDKLLQQETLGAVESTVDKLLADLRTSLSFENLSTNLLEKIDCAYQEAMQRIEAFEAQCIQDAELAGLELLAEQIPLKDTFQNNIQALQSQLDKVIAEYTILVQAKQSLEDELRSEREQREAAYHNLQGLELHILTKEAEIAALETRAAELQQVLEQSYSDSETQRTQARTLEHALRAQLEATHQRATQHTHDLRRELEVTQAQQIQLQAERKQLEQQLRDREQALSHTISTLQARLDQSAQEITTLHQQTQAARADKHTAELALHKLQQQLRQLELHSNTSFTDQLNRLQSENSSLQATLVRLQDQLSSTEQALQRLQSTSSQNTLIESLQGNLTTLTATKQHLEVTVQQLHTQFNQAQSERVQLQNRLSEFEWLEDDRQAARTKASRDIERLEAELAESRLRLAAAVNQSSIQIWLRGTQRQARGIKRWLVQVAVAMAMVCISWISQLL